MDAELQTHFSQYNSTVKSAQTNLTSLTNTPNIHLCQISSHQTNTKSANAANTQSAFLAHSMVTTMEKDTKLEQSHVEKIANTVTWPTTKNGKPHTIPLSGTSTTLVQELQKSLMTYTTSYNTWSKPKTALDRASGVTNWTLHDIRRSVTTHMSRELKVDYLTIEAILNHTSAGVRGVYNRDDRMQEMIYTITLDGDE